MATRPLAAVCGNCRHDGHRGLGAVVPAMKVRNNKVGIKLLDVPITMFDNYPLGSFSIFWSMVFDTTKKWKNEIKRIWFAHYFVPTFLRSLPCTFLGLQFFFGWKREPCLSLGHFEFNSCMSSSFGMFFVCSDWDERWFAVSLLLIGGFLEA